MIPRDEKIEIIKSKFLEKGLAIVGSFDNVTLLVRHKIESKCLKCQHVWQVCVDKVINQGRNCPKCARKSCGEKNRVIQLKRSLENYTKYGNYREYKKHVRTFTYQTIKMYSLFTNVKIGKRLDLYHVDHIMSKWDCFTNRIAPHVTGSFCNLQALLGLANLEKCKQSWQSKDELIKNYQEWIVSHPEYQKLIDTLPKYEFQAQYSADTA